MRRALGLGAVLLAASVSGASARAADEVQIYTVQPGESLWMIAANAIGDATLWPALYRANRDQIKDPHLLYPGQRLAIPEIDPKARAAVRGEASTLLTR